MLGDWLIPHPGTNITYLEKLLNLKSNEPTYNCGGKIYFSSYLNSSDTWGELFNFDRLLKVLTASIIRAMSQ
jgi:hypothetical protein